MSGRTPEEREAARLERERRRAARRGEPLPAAPRLPWAAPSPEAAPPAQPAPPAQAPPPAPPAPRAQPAPPVAAPEPVATETPPVHADGFDDEPYTDEHEVLGDSEAAAGTRRVTGLERARSAETSRRSPRASRRRPHGPRAGAGGRLWGGRAAAAVAIVLGAALLWFLNAAVSAIPWQRGGTGDGDDSGTRDLGAGRRPARPRRSDLVGLLLQAARDARWRARQPALGHLHATARHELRERAQGARPHRRRRSPTRNLTVIEGDTRAKLSKLLHGEGIAGNYLAATRRSPLLQPTAYGAPRSTPSLEGFLFPSTYQLRVPIRISALVADQLKTFKSEFAHVNLGYAREQAPHRLRRPHDRLDGPGRGADRPRPAAGRLGDLQPPARRTCRCRSTPPPATPPATTPRRSPSRSCTRLAVQHLHPPGPAADADQQPGARGDPGRRAPRAHDYLYFVVKPCGNGAHAFAASYAQFLADAGALPLGRARAARRSLVREFCQLTMPRRGSGCSAGRSGHSRSPAMQNAALRAVGLGDWRYQLLPVPAGAVRRDGRGRCPAPASAART